MKAVVDAPSYDTIYGTCNLVEPSVIYDEKTDEIHVFVLNAEETEETELTLDLQGFGDRKLVKHLALYGDDLEAINTIEEPDKVTVKEMKVSGTNTAVLPKLSFNVLVLK